MPAAFCASEAMAITSRSAGLMRAFSMARCARSEIDASGVCSSLTTPEMRRPMAASFSVRNNCSCTETLPRTARSSRIQTLNIAGVTLKLLLKQQKTKPCSGKPQ